MTPEGYWAVGIIAGIIVLLATNRVAIETAMLGGLLLMVLVGAVDAQTALDGFAHPAVMAIAALFVVAEGLRATGATAAAGRILLGRPKTQIGAQFRLMAPVALLSAFVNNTPIVAMYVPIVRDWAKRIRVSPSRLLIPLSFSSILGGQLTVIGSASNLIVMGLYLEYASETGLTPPSPMMEFWGPAFIGLPAAVVGIAYMVGMSPVLLPERVLQRTSSERDRTYTVHMEVLPGTALARSTIESAGLSALPGLSLFQIQRPGDLISEPAPDTRLEPGDRLGFTGILDSVIDLQVIPGLVPVRRPEAARARGKSSRELVQVVIAADSPLVGQRVSYVKLRPSYDAAIVAVHRNKTAMPQSMDAIVLQAGDTLVLEGRPGFAERHRASSDFSLVSLVSGFEAPKQEKMLWAVGVFVAFMAGLMLLPFEKVVSCLIAGFLMVGLGCLSMGKALASVNLRVVVAIGAALGMSAALEQTGAAGLISSTLLGTAREMGFGEFGMVFTITLTASAFGQVITKNGAAALMFPVAMATAREMGIHPEPFVYCLILGCGLAFLSPVAYQTNMMVYGPGAYRFLDFPRIGLPLTIVLALICAAICPIVFPFTPLP